ncbi:unnamed protein product [Pleuronectes platessa]|uniref:Uncharacterized protein n=1 Tax=Pleuronectes platessa TaxID=8262 RepID=A0A9N7YWI8_PLEPL|nr:unnamed protein product [Pleuronectes platessa]
MKEDITSNAPPPPFFFPCSLLSVPAPTPQPLFSQVPHTKQGKLDCLQARGKRALQSRVKLTAMLERRRGDLTEDEKPECTGRSMRLIMRETSSILFSYRLSNFHPELICSWCQSSTEHCHAPA